MLQLKESTHILLLKASDSYNSFVPNGFHWWKIDGYDNKFYEKENVRSLKE